VYLELAIVNVNHKRLCRVLPEIVIVTHLKERMWSGALVAHTTPVQEDLGLILIQIQYGIFLTEKTLISILSDIRL
jgi:hypothetical protein